jgi:hypothetical protein
VARDYGWKGVGARIIDVATLSPAQLGEIAGSYNHGQMRITLDGSTIEFALGAFKTELVPQGADRYVLMVPGGPVMTFKHGADGRIASAELGGRTYDRDP